MRALLAIVGVAAGFFAGAWWRGRAVDACEQRAQALARERDEARSQQNTQLAATLAMAARGRDEARRARPAMPPPPSAPPTAKSDDDDGDGGKIKTLPERHSDFVTVMSSAKEKGHEALDRMLRDARLSSDQRAALDRGVQAMNLAIGDAIERFAKLEQGDPKDARLRDVLPILIDGLGAIKKADDDFRASLEPDQQRAVDDDRFEVASQIDPLVFLRLMVPPAEAQH